MENLNQPQNREGIFPEEIKEKGKILGHPKNRSLPHPLIGSDHLHGNPLGLYLSLYFGGALLQQKCTPNSSASQVKGAGSQGRTEAGQ